MKEILTIGKLAYEVQASSNYDLVVVDSVASGHIVGQLTAPLGINELVQVGLVRKPDPVDDGHLERPGARPAW
ncbi:MAG: hypothetical protein KDA98_01985 [Acidimicrobiales bacterium]|nr:hypothetical protein [Acidimicrobiales bacterium]